MFITNINLPEIRYVYSSDDFLLMLPYLSSLRVSSYYIQIHVSTIFKYKPVFLPLHRNSMPNKYFLLKMSTLV